MKYITDFHKSRRDLIGSSDMTACIQHPEKHESLSGYGRTAITVYKEKRGELQREPAGLAAEIGHTMEMLILSNAIYKIEVKRGKTESQARKIVSKFERGYIMCELDSETTQDDNGNTYKIYHNADKYQTTDWLHHTEASTADSISHADCINIAKPDNAILIEAKCVTTSFYKRGDDPYKGYDLEDETFRGVPLRNYMQTEHQAATYNAAYGIKFKRSYLALIADGKHSMWNWKPDVRMQERIIELCSYLKKCIDTGVLPSELAMNSDDVKIVYPVIKEDFKVLSGEDLEKALLYARAAKDAAQQEKNWKAKAEDAKNALAVMLADSGRIRGIVDGEMVELAAWTEKKGSDRIMSLSEVKQDKRLYAYCEKNGMIKAGEPSRFISVKFKA